MLSDKLYSNKTLRIYYLNDSFNESTYAKIYEPFNESKLNLDNYKHNSYKMNTYRNIIQQISEDNIIKTYTAQNIVLNMSKNKLITEIIYNKLDNECFPNLSNYNHTTNITVININDISIILNDKLIYLEFINHDPKNITEQIEKIEKMLF